jgi:uncharacterized protein (TIGR03437 family)
MEGENLMISLYVRQIRFSALVTVAMACAAVASQAATAPNVTYIASGTLGSIVSGADNLKLSGQPYSISVVINAAADPKKYGTDYAIYSPVSMTGAVTTGLTGESEPIASNSTSVLLEIVPNTKDGFQAAFPLKILDLSIKVNATVTLPVGSLPKLSPHPFTAPINLTSSMGTVTYSGTCESGTGTCTTVLEICTTTADACTLDATIPSSSTTAAPLLHSAAARVVTYHKDATVSTHPVASGPVDLGVSSDLVTLEFYAKGVTGASDVRAQIAGRDATVLYAGPAAHFPGLDQVTVEVPHDLAGRGNAEVVMSVDGRTAAPVNVQLQ